MAGKPVHVKAYNRSKPEKRANRPAGKPPKPKGGKPGQWQWSSAQGRWVNLGKG
jgi:hypothetical protein